MSARTFRIIITAITLLAFALRALTLTSQSLWRDEVDALLFATRPLPQLLEMFRQPGQNGPLFFLGLRPWLGVAGHSEFALRFPSALAGTLAVPLCASLVTRLAGRRPGLLAGVLMATAPYAIWYSQEAKMYALLTVLVPASLLAVERIGRSGDEMGASAVSGPARSGLSTWPWWLALIVLTSLSFYTHLLTALVVPVQVLWLLILPWRPRWTQRAAGVLLYLFALALPYVPFLRWAPQVLASTFETGHPFVSFGDIFQILASAFNRGVVGFPAPTLLPYMLALVAGLVLWPLQAAGQAAAAQSAEPRGLPLTPSRQTTKPRLALLLAIWLLLPPLLVYLISLQMPIFTDRYMIWTLPAYCALLACGVVALGKTWRPLGVTIAALILALNGWSMYLQVTRPIKADFRAAAAYVVERYAPGDAIMYQIPYNRYTFTYYASGRHNPEDPAWLGVDGPYTNAGMPEAEADAWMATRLGGAKTVWLIASETSMWDERNLTGQWLDAETRTTDRAEFARVTITRRER